MYCNNNVVIIKSLAAMGTTNLFADKFATTKIKSLGVSLTTYYCGNTLAYKMYVDGKLLFKGTDLRPSPLRNWDSLETSVDLLSFLAVGIHDTDSEYFKDYNVAQLAWANNEYHATKITTRETLSGLLSDFEDTNGDFHTDAIKEFKHKTY